MFWEPLIWNTITTNFYFVKTFYDIDFILINILLGQIIAVIGVFGILRRTTSILLILLCFELSLLGINYTVIFIGLLLNSPFCFILSMIFLLLSAVETAIGLSLVFVYYKIFETTTLKFMSKLRF